MENRGEELVKKKLDLVEEAFKSWEEKLDDKSADRLDDAFKELHDCVNSAGLYNKYAKKKIEKYLDKAYAGYEKFASRLDDADRFYKPFNKLKDYLVYPVTRPCEICGRQVKAGMTNDSADFYVHKGSCFRKMMDSAYGKGYWMALGNYAEDQYGGHYITTADVPGGYEGTGIFYTEWTELEED